MLKFSTFLILVIAMSSHFGQKPGSEIYFGNYDKKEKNGLLKKYPERYQTIEHEVALNMPEAEVKLSRVFKGDTVAKSLSGYYVEFKPEHLNTAKPDYEFYTDYVSNADWCLFREYVRDSTARRILGEEVGADGWLTPVYDEFGDQVYEQYWNLDWETKLDYGNPWSNDLYGFLSRLYYPPHERMNGKREIDERDLYYEYYWVDLLGIKREQKEKENNSEKGPVFQGTKDYSKYVIREVCSVFRDSTVWIKDTSLTHFGNLEDGLVRHYGCHEEFSEMPVVGVSQPQARAYLNWLENLHNKYLRKKEIQYTVEYELPSSGPLKELPKVEIPSFELDAWMISNKEYKAFVEYVRDSIARRTLGYELGAEGFLIPTYDYFLGEKGEGEWKINWKGKIDWERKTSGEKYGKGKAPYGVLGEMFYPPISGDTNLIDKRKLNFEYLFYDFKTAAIDLPREDEDHHRCEILFGQSIDKTCLKPQEVECFRGGPFYGKGLDLSNANSKIEDTDVFAHEDRSNFIIRDQINIYPGINYRAFNKRCDKYCQWGNVYNYDDPCSEYDCEMCPQIVDWENTIPEEYDFDANPDAPVQGLTYYQYRAYWMWWNKERRKEVKGNPVIADYIPSEEEFVRLQKGESIVHPKEVHELPSPTFNYLVKFYKIKASTNN